jgi:RNA polymerase sigma factor (sigma-70 family)
MAEFLPVCAYDRPHLTINELRAYHPFGPTLEDPNREPAAMSRDPEPPSPFETTHWSLVAAAGEQDAQRANEALAVLCNRYWQPLYAYVRRSGHSLHDAQDLTQQFFVKLLDKEYLQVADRERGRFRSFLLAALKHFLSNERKSARAQKRGGGHRLLSWDFVAAENALLAEPVDQITPVMLFDRRWALLLLDAVLARLELEFASRGKQEHFQHLKPLLTADRDAQPYRQVAELLGINEAAVKMTVHRMRRRYRELLREEIAQTVVDPRDVEDELKQLFEILSRKNT